jgi:hypothetical protein
MVMFIQRCLPLNEPVLPRRSSPDLDVVLIAWTLLYMIEEPFLKESFYAVSV